MFTEKEAAFLVELTELTKKHGVYITGCGCCGSPSLCDLGLSQSDSLAGYGHGGMSDVQWLDPTEFGWDKLKATIPRAGGT